MKLSPNKLILTNANIITLEPHFPHASWVAAENGKFFALGYSEDWKNFANKNTTVIDCIGKTVLPGFIDAHLHLLSYAQSFLNLDLSPANHVHSIADIQAIIRKNCSRTPAGRWILGRGYHEFDLVEKRHPNRWDLDKAAPGHPVRLAHRSGHAHVLNSLALKSTGISKETGDPDGGIIERDLNTVEPTGLLYEMGEFLAERIPLPGPSELESGLQMADKCLVSAGITSIQDASSRNDGSRLEVFKSWKTSGFLHPRINLMLGYPAFIQNDAHRLSGHHDTSELRIGAVKIILDDTTGRLYPPQPELNEMVLKVHESGRQVAIHAIEESAIDAACSAVQFALKKIPRRDHRHRIEHCSVCPSYLAKRIAALGIIVVTQPPFVYHNGERYLATVPDRQLEHLYPLKTLLEHQIRVAGSSDCPIVPPNPLIGIYAAVTRKAATGKTLGAHNKIQLKDALPMYTLASAHAMLEETARGSITAGKLADLVVLNADPGQLPPEELCNLQVEMTIVGGEVVWKKGS